jgi:hypothetical protein
VKGRVLNKLKERIPQSNEKIIEEIGNRPITEYKETLYTDSYKPKKETYAYSNQTMWRNIQAIERNVDTIHIDNTNKPSNDLEKIVDRIIAKKKK